MRSVSATTRPPRPGETDGIDYHFLSDEEFQLRRQRGDFLECFEVFGQGHWYGTLRSEVTTGLAAGKWVVLEIDVQGALAVMQRFPTRSPSSSGPVRRRNWNAGSAAAAPRPKRPSSGGWPGPSASWPWPSAINTKSSTTTWTRRSRKFATF